MTGLAIREEGGKKYLVLSWPVNPEAADVAFSVESCLLYTSFIFLNILFLSFIVDFGLAIR